MCGWCVPVSNWYLGITMGTPLPPIYRGIRRLLVHADWVVPRFARHNKYTVGTDYFRLQEARESDGKTVHP